MKRLPKRPCRIDQIADLGKRDRKGWETCGIRGDFVRIENKMKGVFRHVKGLIRRNSLITSGKYVSILRVLLNLPADDVAQPLYVIAAGLKQIVETEHPPRRQIDQSKCLCRHAMCRAKGIPVSVQLQHKQVLFIKQNLKVARIGVVQRLIRRNGLYLRQLLQSGIHRPLETPGL